jgi:demethylmenaquinone methyltransferase/2-methoxy-6-polyprenyl-1,4-benzoquinol methylase
MPGNGAMRFRAVGYCMSLLEDKGRAKTFYRYLSTVYDEVNKLFWTEAMRSEALSMLTIDRTDRVLDVGCGTGFGTAGLLDHTDRVDALDQSPEQLDQARAKFGDDDRVTLHRGDAERLPFADDSFDVGWSSGSIEYWPNPVEALRELRRVAKPGGQVLVVGPDAPNNAAARRLADAVMLFYDEAEATRMFRDAGFTEIRHRVLQRSPRSPRAIATVAVVPERYSSPPFRR